MDIIYIYIYIYNWKPRPCEVGHGSKAPPIAQHSDMHEVTRGIVLHKGHIGDRCQQAARRGV